MSHTHPALDFLLYGLSPSWVGPRWLHFLEGERGEPVWAAWLAHGESRIPAPGEPWVLVGSLPNRRFREVMTPPDGEPEREVAFSAFHTLVNLASPAGLDEEQASRYRRRVVRLTELRASAHRIWETCTWQVDGGDVSGHITRWAGAWAGFSLDVSPTTSVMVVGFGTDPLALELDQVTDYSIYHFKGDSPMVYPDVLRQSEAAALPASARGERTRPIHPDQERLLSEPEVGLFP